MCAGLTEVREQFELPTASGRHGHMATPNDGWVEGTEAIARDLKVRHPRLSHKGVTRLWSMTSDLVLYFGTTVADPNGGMLAVAVKYAEELKRPRVLELLTLEREFWRRQGVPWLLITPDLYHPLSQGVLGAGLAYVVGQERVPAEHIALCRELQPIFGGLRMQRICEELQRRIGTTTTGALSVFWGSVWSGALTLDIGQAWRSDQRVRFVSASEFLFQNPIASRRSSWCD